MGAPVESGRSADTDAAVTGEGKLSAPAASERYPTDGLPFVAAQLPQDRRFADAVEEFLLGYRPNTARAYLCDLVDIYTWARERKMDFFALTEADIRRYQSLLRRRKYSEGTVRRRGTAWRALRKSFAG